jgi:hypothetical protein
VRRVATTVLAIFGLLLTLDGRAEIALDENERIVVFGDFRTRLETDWDSSRGDGSERDDRGRLRGRARFGLRCQITDGLLGQLRVASGSDDNQQSTNITVVDFNDNDTGDSHFNLDRYFLKRTLGNGHVWVGKNALPFWKQNGVFWDGDAPVAGLAFHYELPLHESTLAFNTGYFSLPVGMQDFAGNLGLGQVVYESTTRDVGWTLAGGLLAFDANPGDADADRLLDGNGSRNYSVGVLSAQARWDLGGTPLKIGFDYTHNFKDYSASASDAFTAFHRNETDGWHVQAMWGNTENPWDWQAGLAYSRIEMFAVHNSYSQDDSVRWGADNQARVSNFEGPELRAGLGLGHEQRLVARLFFVDAIRKRASTDFSREDGHRFRLDYSVAF